MKKLISGLLAAVLFVCMSSVAFAAPRSVPGGSKGTIELSDCSGVQEETVQFSENQDGNWVTVKRTITVYLVAPNSTAVLPPKGLDGYVHRGSTLYFQNGEGVYVAEGGGPADTVTFEGQYQEGLYQVSVDPETWIYCRIAGGAAASAPSQETAKPAAQADASSGKTTHSRSTDISYKVKAGDTLATLALNYYGDMTFWPAIVNYNQELFNKKAFTAGLELVLPGAVQHGKQAIAIIPPAVAGEGEDLYTVQPGDTYGTIAQARFGTMARYKEIFDRNSDRLKNIDTLFAGQILVLPKK